MLGQSPSLVIVGVAPQDYHRFYDFASPGRFHEQKTRRDRTVPHSRRNNSVSFRAISALLVSAVGCMNRDPGGARKQNHVGRFQYGGSMCIRVPDGHGHMRRCFAQAVKSGIAWIYPFGEFVILLWTLTRPDRFARMISRRGVTTFSHYTGVCKATAEEPPVAG